MSFDGLELTVSGDNIVEIDPDCTFQNSRIAVEGDGNTIKIEQALTYKRLIINLKGNNKLIHIRRSSKFINSLKIISIRGNGQSVVIGENLSLGGMELQLNDGDEHIRIGRDCLFSWGIKMRTSDGHALVDLSSGRAINLPRDIHIADRVWIGEDARLLKGATVPPDSVVGSGSIVTSSFSFEVGNIVIAGVPAKVVKRNIRWDRERPTIYNLKLSRDNV